MRRQLLGMGIGTLALIAGIISYTYGPRYLGKAQAHFDLARGKYRLRVGPQGSARFNEIMSKEYGVEIVTITSPVPDNGDELMDIRSCRPCQVAEGYDDVMLDALNKRYGHFVLQRVWERMEQDAETREGP